MKKADDNTHNIEVLRQEYERQFFGVESPAADKIAEFGQQLDEIDPLSADEKARIQQGKRELLAYTNKLFEEEANTILLQQANRLRKSKISYKLGRTAAVFVLVLLGTSITTNAFGINLFSFIAEFGDNINKLKLIPSFTISQPTATTSAPVEDLPIELGITTQYDNISDALSAMPCMPKFPTYFKKDYLPLEISISNFENSYARFNAIYAEIERSTTVCIAITYFKSVADMSETIIFEGDYDVVERFSDTGIEYMVIKDAYQNQHIYWTEGHFTYVVYSQIDLNELKKIVDTFN